MNTRSLTALAVLTAAVVAAAIASNLLRSGGPAPNRAASDHPLFPQLEDRINDVEIVRIESGGRSVDIRRRDGRWIVESLDGYPAKFEDIKALLMGVAGLEIAERKTADPTRHARLGLEPPGDGRPSRLVSLGDGTGATVAAVIIGSDAGTGGQSLVYVRRADEDQTWLARGRVDAYPDPMRWVDASIVSIPRARVKTVTIAHADGERVTITRPDAAVADFTPQGLPEGMTPAAATQVNAIADGLSFLRMEGVRAARDQTPDPTTTVTTTFETFDGLIVEVRSWEVDGTIQAVLSARADRTEAPEASDEEPRAGVEAEELTERFDGWVYDLPKFAGDRLRRRLSDVAQPAETQESNPDKADDEPAAPWERPIGGD
ncbi:MAG: DUF4340 domain-containing protein [Phycisphaerales bacterium]|nr:DUF4340 domain-containing protein [Phycisphaerales bacterium]